MAKRTTSRGAAALRLLLVLLAAVAATATTSTTEIPTSVWDAYPASMMSVCPHIPRRPITFSQLNGRWLVMEKGGVWRPQQLCAMDFQVEEGQNLTLHISLRAFNDRNLENTFNSTWVMSNDNVWRDYADSQMYMFVGYSTGRTLLMVCAVDSWEGTQNGYSFALTRRTHERPSVLKAARLNDNIEATDRSHCPEL